MRNILQGVLCFLSVSMSVTMSAQADINDYMNAQVTGTEIFMEYDHQKMLDEIDAQNLLLGSVPAPVITSGATGTDLFENTGADQPVYTITATATIAAWPAPTFAIGGTDFDAGSLSVNASTGVVTLTVDPVYATQSSYSFTVTATDAANNTSAATAVTFSITVPCGVPVTYDGHSYATVEIGNQCWFAENLRTTVYADGSPIPEVTGNSAWAGLSTGARCDYVNYASNVATYGRLYNWYAVNTGNLCPSGWHVPTDLEYTTLTDFLGGASVAGGAMKSSASDSPAWDGTNTSGFSGLAGGYRNSNGVFDYGGDIGYFWSASAYGTYAWNRRLYGGISVVIRNYNDRRYGFSVRCVRD